MSVDINSKAYNITEEDLVYAKNALIQLLLDAGYEGTMEDGTAVYDLLIKPNALLYTILQKDITKAKAYLSLDKAKEAKDILGDEYDKVVDDILSNWFVTRKTGRSSRGIVRCYFSKPLEVLQITPENTYFTIDNLKYIPEGSSNFTKENFVKRDTGTVLTTTVYLDIPVVSVDATDNKVTMGSTVVGSVNSMYYLKAEIPFEFTHGESMEDSETFINRSKDVITTRELISYKAIKTVLINEFDNLSDVFIAGYGDTELVRDIRTFDRITMHVGNHADIYCNVPLFTNIINLPVVQDNIVEMKIGDDNIYVVDVLKVVYHTKDDAGNNISVDMPFYIQGIQESTWCSNRHITKLFIDTTKQFISTGDTVEVTYITSSLLPTIQSFIESDDIRVVNYDPLAKSKFPIIIDFALEFTRAEGSFTATEDIISNIKDLIVEYTTSIPMYDTFSISDLIYYIKSNSSDVGLISTPITVNYRIRQLVESVVINVRQGLSSWVSGYFTNTFVFPGGISNQVTGNTCVFWTDPSLLNVTIKE